MQSLAQIAECIRLATGYDLDALRAKKRDTFRVAARQLFCYFAKQEGYSLNAIGSFVNIDHATALHSLNRIKEMKDTDTIIKEYIKKYETMSKKKQMAEIHPPEYSNCTENDLYDGFSCPTCNGRGFHIDHSARETKEIPCERCTGTGRLRAKVTIQWEADK